MKQIKWLTLFVFILILSQCRQTAGEIINQRTKEPFDDTKNLIVNFVTTRRVIANSAPACDSNYFGFLTDINPHYGDCTINIPAKHSVGDITWNNTADRNLYFQLLGKKDKQEDEFFQQLKASSSEELLLFVHGFNVNFDEAVIRAGQIRYDLKFLGEVVVYSWPAGAEAGVINTLMMKSTYESNFQEAKLNREHFNRFLNQLQGIKKRVHLIVHSMGHQVVLPSLAKQADEGKSKIIAELILNAPDFDKEDFSKISSKLRTVSERVTLYCSPGDNALIASQKVNGGNRAGMCFKFEGIDVINVNEVDSPVLGIGGLGHGYYSSRPILSDIYQVILGVDVNKRLFIRKSGQNNGENWVLRR
ncbi:lipoprotein [Leptospira ryugenii]|uniref:Lipoprotein n=1 Tax=Leptospira ryugenii TaxID=1917863 RepID=A0A2P2DXZ6_9LEPT|nr:alpha/beta hydrolase [Leptospira ryugenii]GBF49493.1 lipoprotein [Leptospira ryugenii]